MNPGGNQYNLTKLKYQKGFRVQRVGSCPRSGVRGEDTVLEGLKLISLAALYLVCRGFV